MNELNPHSSLGTSLYVADSQMWTSMLRESTALSQGPLVGGIAGLGLTPVFTPKPYPSVQNGAQRWPIPHM